MRTSIGLTCLLSLTALTLTACGGGGGGDGGSGGGGGGSGGGGGGGGTPPTPTTYSIGGTVTGLTGTGLVLQNNGANNLTVTANGAFTFSTALASGTAYAVTVQTQPSNQTCTVSSGTGTVGSAAVTNVSVTCSSPIGKFLYVPNALSNDISAFSINPATGVLTAVSNLPYAAGQAPSLASVDPAGKFLYIVNRGSASLPPSLGVYAINASTGVLTENAASPFPLTQTAPAPTLNDTYNKPVIHPSGSFGYLTGVNSGRIYGAAADATGTLTEIPGMNQLVGNTPGFGDFDVTGKYLFVPYGSPGMAGSVAVYQFNDGSGVLTPQGTVGTGAGLPRYSAMTPDNKFLIVANAVGTGGSPPGALSVYSFNATNGTLTAAAGSPFDTGGLSSFVAVHPTKNFVYTNDSQQSGVVGFRLDSTTGVLTPVPGSPFATANAVTIFIRIDPTGKFLYSGSSSGSVIHGFAINQDTGALTPVPGSPFTAGTNPNVITMDPSGRYLFTTNSGSNNVSSFVIDPATGSLTLANTIAAGTAPVAAEIVGRQ